MVYVLLRIFNLLHYRVLESLMSYVDQCEKLYVDHEELKEELERLKDEIAALKKEAARKENESNL